MVMLLWLVVVVGDGVGGVDGGEEEMKVVW